LLAFWQAWGVADRRVWSYGSDGVTMEGKLRS
jgi:hypothetical protein